MLNYTFENIGRESLYEHLYRCIREDIMTGQLSPGEKMPSKRTLARQLSVSVMTVENAYGQLLSEGFLVSRPRRGYFVAEIPPYGFSVLPEEKNSSQPKEEKTTGTSAKKTAYFADLSSNAVSPSDFPFVTWAKLSRRILSDNRDTLMQNSPFNGLYDLRRAISDHLKAFRSLHASPDNIVIGAGTETLYTLLIQLLGRDRVYASEDPGYHKIVRVLQANGIRNVRIPIDDAGIRLAPLTKSGASVVHITPSHHFPTGITMPFSRRVELLKWASVSSDRYLIEDEYDSEFRMQGRPVPALFSLDQRGHVIYMNTFTKSLSPTIRISYMILPDSLMNRYRRTLSFYSCPVSNFEQLILADFISGGYFEKHINRMRTLSRRKRDLFLSEIEHSPLADISEIREENAGLHFILKLRLSQADEAFLKRASDLEIHLLPVSAYGSGTTSPHCFLINYSSVSTDLIPEIVNRLSRAALPGSSQESR